MKFGVGYAYWGTEWKCDYHEVTRKLAKIGFDVLEIAADHLYYMTDDEIEKLKKLGEECGIEFSTNSGPAKEYDLASRSSETRANGVAYFKKIIDNMNKLGSNVLVGAIYSYWPSDYAEKDKAFAWEKSIEALKEIGDHAQQYNIHCALEILNRNETYILNDSKEAMEYVNLVGKESVNILLDTYHMNIEEDNMFDAIRSVGDQLGHVHVGENNRKLPGMNNSIDWKEFGKALRDINYDKYIVMEPFLLAGGDVGRDIRVFRDLSDNADAAKMDEYIKTSLEFLRKCCLAD